MGCFEKIRCEWKVRALKGIYASVLACVGDKCSYTNFFECPRGVKQACVLSPLVFSFFVNEKMVFVVIIVYLKRNFALRNI